MAGADRERARGFDGTAFVTIGFEVSDLASARTPPLLVRFAGGEGALSGEAARFVRVLAGNVLAGFGTGFSAAVVVGCAEAARVDLLVGMVVDGQKTFVKFLVQNSVAERVRKSYNL